MEKHRINSVANWKTLFPEAVIDEKKAEKEVFYHSAHFGIRALEYVVFIGTLLTLGLFTGAVFQVMSFPPTGFFLVAAISLIGLNLLLHLLVKQRLVDALATGIGTFGIMSFCATLFSSGWKDEDAGLLLIFLLLFMILVSRKNLLTILGIVGIFWIINWLFDEYDVVYYKFKLVVMFFTLVLALLIYLEEAILVRIPKWSYFFNYLKHGFFIALVSYYVVSFVDWPRGSGPVEAKWYDYSQYFEILLLAAALFIWQYGRLKNEGVPLWLVVFLPLSLFLLGAFSVQIAFFLLAFLAFLFTRSIFGIVTSALGLIFAVIHFYYELNWTLMQKSLVFIGLGALYLVLYFVLTSKKTTHE